MMIYHSRNDLPTPHHFPLLHHTQIHDIHGEVEEGDAEESERGGALDSTDGLGDFREGVVGI